MPDDEATYESIRIWRRTCNLLRVLAELDQRTLVAQINVIAEEAAERRGLPPPEKQVDNGDGQSS